MACPSEVSTSPKEIDAPSMGRGSGIPVLRVTISRGISLGGVWVIGMPATLSSPTVVELPQLVVSRAITKSDAGVQGRIGEPPWQSPRQTRSRRFSG